MKKNLPIGTSDFKDLRIKQLYFIDKSLIIKELVNDSSSIILIPRPRRFGKTLNMSMLRYFFDTKDAAENRKLFLGLNICSETEFEEQGKYPVIFITFKDVKFSNFEDAFSSLQNLVTSAFFEIDACLDFSKFTFQEKQDIEAIKNRTCNLAALGESLRLLTDLIFKSTGLKPILLIDEYDTPIHSAYTERYYKQMVDFMRVFLSRALKDNSSLHKGVLTGTLRISKESIFTGLNNPSVYTLLSYRFSDKFGFTQDEVSKMLADFELEDQNESVKYWYNGYVIGKTDIYNPWSIINYVHASDEGFKAHWVNTSSNDLIKEIVKDSPATVHTEIQDLISGKALVKTLNENISFPELKDTDDDVFSFFVFSGYLKARLLKFENSRYWYELTIPNEEVKILFVDIIRSWFKETFRDGKNIQMLQALLEKDVELFGEILGESVLQNLSVHDVERRHIERVYQAFLLGVLVTLSPDYEVTSNKESGFGRYDICIVPVKDKSKPCIIMELKSIRISETAETALVSALKQIEDKKYETSIRQRGYEDIVKLGVVFDGKRVWVKV